MAAVRSVISECKEKVICFPTLGEIIKDCKCQKCPLNSIPGVGGNACEENCPEGQEKNDKGGCCPIGQKPKATGDGCEPKQSNDDRKGGCPGDTVLDPKQGWDAKPEAPRCQIDDEKDCPKPKVPATRPDGLENDTSFKVACGEPDKDESKRPKCDPKNQYVHVFVDSDGKAVESCKQTRKYYDRKRTKPTDSDVRAKIKDTWNKMKPDYDKREQERKDSLKKLKEIQEQRDRELKDQEKLKEANDRKKERQAKCSTPIALLLGAAYNEAMNKRDGEHPYDWTTDYFDEDFISSDDRLKEWPEDLDVGQISEDVDTDAFLKKWDEYIDDHKRVSQTCTFVRKRSLDRRCSQRRSLDDWYSAFEPGYSVDNTSSLPRRDLDFVQLRKIDSHDVESIEKRYFSLLFLILSQFGMRLGVQVAARATASVAATSPRLASLLKVPERLFQTAPKGGGTKAGQKGMESAKEAIKKDSQRWLKCLKEGIP
ncbi:hypothetical protein FB567DRAFT_617949 [Paraphoma chrysanthemicola]|uniref:Uncharacterized protein n=1 Tax=Paraphoma chrysanthemicola TaxID=798071 RepID=A0A8K0RD77_9PLEO|nr:hypothetical protein FB567DRAFT_617949 [Paraphoma chrysanthemicola]